MLIRKESILRLRPLRSRLLLTILTLTSPVAGFVSHVAVVKHVIAIKVASDRPIFKCAGADSMSILKIALLGPPEVSHFDQRLTFPDRKALALLAYLATEDGMHERQRLSRLFWPDSDSAHGRTALRITLHHLRRVLEEEIQPEHESHLLITHDALGLNMDSDIDLDLYTLQAAWSVAHDQRVREEAQGEIRRTMIARLEYAAALYRHGFLEDFTLRDTLDFD